MQTTFESLNEEHLPTLTRWLLQPHVRAFWDDGEGTQRYGRTIAGLGGRSPALFSAWTGGRLHSTPAHQTREWFLPLGGK